MHPLKVLVILPTAAWFLTACNGKEQSVAPTVDNEALTTATLQLTNKANPADVATATIENLTAMTVDFSQATLRLKAGTTYSGQILQADKSQTPADDATLEIRERLNEHLFVYTPAPASLLTVTITDKDTNPAPGPYPVGLTFDVVTGPAGTGTLRVVLKHQPNTKNGQAAPGSTDLDTTYPVVIN